MRILLFLVILFTGVAAIAYVYLNKHMILRHVQIEGDLPHVDMALVEATILPFVQQSLLRTNITAIQDALHTLPWVSSAHVSRLWPDTLYIWLAEPETLALWADGGVVSEEGHVFYVAGIKDDALSHLPVFEGLEGEAPMMLAYYQKMLVMLQPLGLSIQTMVLTPRYAWEVQLSDGSWLRLGQHDIMERFQRLVHVYPQLNPPVTSVDLRYPNGIAVNP